MPGMPIPAIIQQGLDSTKVDYVPLGSSGLRVSFPILGAMSFGSSAWGPWVLDEAAGLKILKAAYDRGINTWDTANMYSNGLSEAVIGKALKQFEIPREKVVIMSKCMYPVAEQPGVFAPPLYNDMLGSKDYVHSLGLSRGAIFNQVEASLARLGTSYIDIYIIHRYDPTVPAEETMKALHDLVQSGKVRYIGASSMWATQFATLQFVAEKHGWTKFISMENLYHLGYREEEREMIRFCKATGVGLTPWSSQWGGKLCRPLEGANDSVRSKMPNPHGDGMTEADETIIRRVEEVAGKRGWKMSSVALLWHRAKGTVPIVGFNKVERIEEACELKGKQLTEEEVKYLEEPYVPKPIMGHS